MRRNGSSPFLATFVAWSVVVHALLFSSKIPFSIGALIFPTINLAAIVLGIILCYRVNRSGDNSDFIGRMVCLGWPIGIWYAVFYSPFFLIMQYIGHWEWFSATMWWLGLFYISSYYSSIARLLIFVAQSEPAAVAVQRKQTEWTTGKVLLGILGGIGIFIIAFISAEPALSRFAGEGVAIYILVWLLLAGPDFVRLWRSSPKHP